LLVKPGETQRRRERREESHGVSPRFSASFASLRLFSDSFICFGQEPDRPVLLRQPAKGEIASLAGAADDLRYFQLRLPVQPGNSGGTLVYARGNVAGIVAAKLDASAALAKL